jgi:hypothetical protein
VEDVLYILNTNLFNNMLISAAASVPELGTQGVILTNPDVKTKFPICVISPPDQEPRYMSEAVELLVTVEVWADRISETLEIFDKVKVEFAKINLINNGNIKIFQDQVTNKYRYGGYFECRWEMRTNTLHRTK